MLIQRIAQQIKKRSPADINRKIAYYFSQQFRLLSSPFRKLRALVYFKNAGVKLGKGVLLTGLSYDVTLGSDVNFYDYCIVEMVGDAAALSIGSHCVFSYGVLLSCRQRISIGNHVMIGEYTSVRDTTHSYADTSLPMKNSPDFSDEVIIGNDVWIGRGCLIMPGTIIEDGAVIAANSVVKGRLESNQIYGGVPARFIKKRNNRDFS